MATPTIKGALAALRQPDRVSFDPARGAVRYAVYESASQTSINAVVASAVALRLPYNTSSTGTKHTVEVEIVGGSSDMTQAIPPFDRWEVLGNEIQKSIWQHNSALSLGAVIPLKAQRALDNGKAWTDFFEGLTLPEGWAEWQSTLLQNFYALASQGSTHYATTQYVLRHVSNAGSGFFANVADMNVERLYTTQRLINECTFRGFWSNPLPARLVFKIRRIPMPPYRSGYLWSWRKMPSTETTSAGGRIEINTEYWLEQWCTLLYPVATNY